MKEAKAGHKRSIELMMSVAAASFNIACTEAKEGSYKFEIKGDSGRWYHVRAARHPTNIFVEPIAMFQTRGWGVQINGAACKDQLTVRGGDRADLCLHIDRNNEKLPIGDSITGLLMSLENDRETSLRIPLIAQFIACPDARLPDIAVFQQEGVVTHEMIVCEDYYEDEEDEQTYEEFLEQQQRQAAARELLEMQPEPDPPQPEHPDEWRIQEEEYHEMMQEREQMYFQSMMEHAAQDSANQVDPSEG